MNVEDTAAGVNNYSALDPRTLSFFFSPNSTLSVFRWIRFSLQHRHWILTCTIWGYHAFQRHSFDCTMRQLALEYARTLRPDKGSFQAVYDALQLWACNSSSISRNADTAAPRATPKAHSFPAGSSANQQHQRKHQHQHRRHQKQQGHEFFVAVTGSDAAAGTVASPFATPQRGVTACRTSIPTPSSTAGCTVTLREGIFYLSDSALALGPEDSYVKWKSQHSSTQERPRWSAQVPPQRTLGYVVAATAPLQFMLT